MLFKVRGFSVALLLLLILAGVAHADLTQELTVHLSENCPFNLNVCQVSPYQQYPGNPAAGLASFGPIDQPWNFNFSTAYPLSWSCDVDCNNYNADFGIGGTFTMGGPLGLNFAGLITSGTAWQNLDLSWGASLSFSGMWSNGMTAHGDILDIVTDQNGPYAALDVYTVPEPASLGLLGAGIFIAWRATRPRI